jgi:hypothetical protein
MRETLAASISSRRGESMVKAELPFACAMSTALQVRHLNPAAPGRGGAGVNNKQLYLLCAVILFTVSNVFRPALLFGLALLFLALFATTKP